MYHKQYRVGPTSSYLYQIDIYIYIIVVYISLIDRKLYIKIKYFIDVNLYVLK